jgi:ubiquinone/menaquinone biosynthesis C-methylase UbiE
MKDYLEHSFNENDPELISIQDELPFWSAPFGMKLLDAIKMKKKISALDIGSGMGFPLIETAQRLGNSCRVYGIDPWKPAIERVKQKINKLGLTNVEIIEGIAEELPFENGYFDLIFSNNGINNVKDIPKVFSECRRVARKGAQFLFTVNLDKTFYEFYDALETALLEAGLDDSIEKMKLHIYNKRRPVPELIGMAQNADFTIKNVVQYDFHYRFNDASAMLNYAMIKYWFLPSWKELVPPDMLDKVFTRVEKILNETGNGQGGIRLSVPFALFDCEK